jgi:hypothetical protein
MYKLIHLETALPAMFVVCQHQQRILPVHATSQRFVDLRDDLLSWPHVVPRVLGGGSHIEVGVQKWNQEAGGQDSGIYVQTATEGEERDGDGEKVSGRERKTAEQR